LRADEHRLLRVSHHIIADNSSWALYFDDLARLYEAKARGEPSPLPEPAPLQYGDFAAWQRKQLDRQGRAFGESVSWWKQNLSGAPPAMALPFLRAQPTSDAAPVDGMMSFGVDRQVSYRLDALSSRHGATRMMVRLAAFAPLLAVEARTGDVVIAMYSSDRSRSVLRKLIGEFSNLYTLRFRCDLTKSFADWLSMVRDEVWRAEAHVIPHEELCDVLQREGVRPPVLQVFFHIALASRVVEFAGLRLSWLKSARQSFQNGFTLRYNDQDEEQGCEALFDPRIYDPAGVRRFVERYKRLLDVASRHPEKALDDLLTLSDLASAFSQATALHGAGLLQEAENIYRRILQARPTHGDSLHLLGVLLHQRGEFEDAVRHIDAALALDPALAAAYGNRGLALHKLNRFAEAVASYDHAIALTPDDARAFYNRGNALHALARFEEAVASYERAVALKRDYAAAFYNRGNALVPLGRFEEALTSYEQAIVLEPDHRGALNNRGVVLQRLGRFDDAVAAYDRALATSGGDASTFHNRGVALLERGQFEAAVASYDRAIALMPGRAASFFHRGRALQALKRLNEAVASYDRAIALKPDYAEALDRRAAAIAELKRID
jgi:tetratricopeptide (TPR) repeat protein